MFGTGPFNVTQNVLPPSGPPFTPAAADNGLRVDAGTGHIVLGDPLGATGPASLLNDREIDQATFRFLFSNGGRRQLDINPTGGEWIFGDTLNLNVVDGIQIQNVTAGGQNFRYFANTARFIEAGPNGGGLGDIDNSIGGPQVQIISAPKRVDVRAGFTQAMSLDMTNFNFSMGDLLGANNGSQMLINDAGQLIVFTAVNGIQTSPPPNGSGNWLLGTVVAAASVLDATQYVEVVIGGATVKLAVIV